MPRNPLVIKIMSNCIAAETVEQQKCFVWVTLSKHKVKASALKLRLEICAWSKFQRYFILFIFFSVLFLNTNEEKSIKILVNPNEKLSDCLQMHSPYLCVENE